MGLHAGPHGAIYSANIKTCTFLDAKLSENKEMYSF